MNIVKTKLFSLFYWYELQNNLVYFVIFRRNHPPMTLYLFGLVKKYEILLNWFNLITFGANMNFSFVRFHI